MKVIGISSNYHKKYICEVSHVEIEKFLNTYYGGTEKLEVGEEIDLGKGYDFFNVIKELSNNITGLVSRNHKVIDIVFKGLNILGSETFDSDTK